MELFHVQEKLDIWKRFINLIIIKAIYDVEHCKIDKARTKWARTKV